LPGGPSFGAKGGKGGWLTSQIPTVWRNIYDNQQAVNFETYNERPASCFVRDAGFAAPRDGESRGRAK
jgi:hypothetical protein